MANQVAYLKREIEVVGVKASILVADSSRQPFDFGSDPSLQYLHTPTMSLPAKLGSALEKVNTPFVMLVPDDDVIILQTVVKCCELLQKESNFSSVGGSVWEHIRADDGEVSIWPEAVHKECAASWRQEAATTEQIDPAIDGLGLMMEYTVLRMSAIECWIGGLKSLRDVTCWQFLLGFALRLKGRHVNLNSPLITRDVQAYTQYQRVFSAKLTVTESFVWDSGCYILAEENFKCAMTILEDWRSDLSPQHKAQIMCKILQASLKFFRKKRIRALRQGRLKRTLQFINRKFLYSFSFRISCYCLHLYRLRLNVRQLVADKKKVEGC